MRQDEAGRWVSDNGRYLWSGSEWVDLQPQDPEQQDPEQQDPERPGGGRSAQSTPESASAAAAHRRRLRRPRRMLVLAGLLLLVVVGITAVLVVGNRSPSQPTSSTPVPDPGQVPPGGLASSPAAPQVLDETQRRDRAERALVRREDLPGTTEERTGTPIDVFLPCRIPALKPPAGTVLAGRTVSNSDFTVYVGQTVAGYPTAREAADALTEIRSTFAKCEPYEYRYANSPRIDRITHTDVGAPLDLGDGGVYLVEVDTPSNYSGSPTTYSYGYVQRGQFLVRLTLTNGSDADRSTLEQLMGRVLAQLG